MSTRRVGRLVEGKVTGDNAPFSLSTRVTPGDAVLGVAGSVIRRFQLSTKQIRPSASCSWRRTVRQMIPTMMTIPAVAVIVKSGTGAKGSVPSVVVSLSCFTAVLMESSQLDLSLCWRFSLFLASKPCVVRLLHEGSKRLSLQMGY